MDCRVGGDIPSRRFRSALAGGAIGIAPLSRPAGEAGPGNMTRRRLGAMLLAVAVAAPLR